MYTIIDYLKFYSDASLNEVKWNNNETLKIFNSKDILDLKLSEVNEAMYDLVIIDKNKGVIITPFLIYHFCI